MTTETAGASSSSAARGTALIDNSIANHLGIVRDRVIMRSMPVPVDARGHP